MTFEDFIVVVITVPESDRMERLFRYFHDADISRFMLDYEPIYTEEPPIPIYAKGAYGCGEHFCNLQDKFKEYNLIYFEDDAIIHSDFINTLNQHLSELPENWHIFMPGYKYVNRGGAKPRILSDNILCRVRSFEGTQCVLFRAGEWRNLLTTAFRTHAIYHDASPHWGWDMCLPRWCKKNDISIYCAKNLL
jgi:hypothetical protein